MHTIVKQPSLIDNHALLCTEDLDLECDINVSTLTSSSPCLPIIVRVCIQEENTLDISHSIDMFLNCRAMGNFIHPCLVKQRGLTTITREALLSLKMVTGT
jgi:hypothetical protein